MGYSTKWVEENLGITEKMQRLYEEKRLMNRDSYINPENGYRDYQNVNIAQLVGIKLLRTIGFTMDEIQQLIYHPEYRFYKALDKKVDKLEVQYHEMKTALEFAKSIKATGLIPKTNTDGSICYCDYINQVIETFNLYAEPQTALYVDCIGTYTKKGMPTWTDKEIDRLIQLFEGLDVERITYSAKIEAYYRAIISLQKFDYKAEQVQILVGLLYDEFKSGAKAFEITMEITPQLFAKHIAIQFLESDAGEIHKQDYGKKGCEFIAKAIAYFGGYDSIDNL